MTVSLAAASLFVGDDGETYVALSRRSSAVAASPGTRSLLPMCSLEGNVAGEETSRLSLLVFNFVREFCEEFFDQQELIDSGTGRRAHPDWFLTEGVPSRLEKMLDDGRLSLWLSGVGLSVVDGGLKISVVARFHDHAFLEFVRRGARTNWETSGHSADPSLQFLKIDDGRWDQWTLDGSLSRTSAFALDRARLFMAGVRSADG